MERVRGCGEGSFSPPVGSGMLSSPPGPAPTVAGIMEGGESLPHHRAQKIAPLVGRVQEDPKGLLSCTSQRFRGPARSKAGCSAPAESSTITLLTTPSNDERCNRPCSSQGRNSKKLFYPGLTAIRFCLKMVSLPPHLMRLACRRGSE